MTSLKEIEKAYIAGIVDGEGTVTLSRRHKNETPSPHVSVANTDLRLIKWLRTKIGGTIISKRNYSPRHRKSYVWTVCQNRALCFLDEIKPFLIVKRRQADLICKDYKIVTHRAGKYSGGLLTRKNQLVSKIRMLNQR